MSSTYGVKKKKEFIEIVPSKWMRNYLRDKKEFTDWEKATLIWNAPNTIWMNRIVSLEELANTTSDVILREQIHDRIQYERNAYDNFITLNKGYVYVVLTEHGNVYGFFDNAPLAVQYGILNASEMDEKYFVVEKHWIISEHNQHGAPKVWRSKKHLSGCEHMVEDKDIGVGGSCVRYNVVGDILGIISYEMSDEENEKVDQLNKERFEFQFFQIPFRMEAGTVVKILDEYDYGNYAVLACEKEKWGEYMERIMRKPYCFDFSDIQTMVYQLKRDGTWTHAHINPLYLEPEIPEVNEEYINSVAYRDALCALGEYIKHPTKENDHKALTASRNYARAWGNESKTWRFNNINDMMD